MNNQEKADLINWINKTQNTLEAMRRYINNDGQLAGKKTRATKATAKTTATALEKKIKKALEALNLPSDSDFISDIAKVTNGKMTVDRLKGVLENIQRANDKSPKENLKAYTFKCIHKEIEKINSEPYY